MSMSVGGLVSGLDIGTLISQLVQAEGAPQAALKTRLSVANASAAAYRSINTKFDAIRTAAEALTTAGSASARMAKSSDASVTASAGSTAAEGSAITFTVQNLASAQTVRSNTEWASTTTDVRTQEPGWPIEIRTAAGAVVGFVDVPAGATLADAVAAINAKDLGVKATAVQIGGKYRLQISGEKTGAAESYVIKSANETDATAGSGFTEIVAAQDATLDMGGGQLSTSTTNTFAELMTEVSVTVSKADPLASVTVSVGSDSQAFANKVQALVDAVNGALSSIKANADPKGGASSTLKGDSALRTLTGRILDAAAFAVGSDGSPATAGIELKQDGTIAFDKAAFTTALEADPTKVQRLFVGGPAGPGPDSTLGNADDIVPGIAQRLLDVARTASDSTTGSLTLLAQGRNKLAEDIQDKIEAWDIRLARRKEMLTRQFTAMETALGSLQQQSSWLAGQIGSLPSYS